ncbi:MAG: hypothetical protein IKV54_03200 [Clostridia bacterium]|nr:hypothetical protein [Clostridia bacterium]
MDTENKKKKRKGGPTAPGEARRSRRLLEVSDKLLCVIEGAVDECLREETVPDKNTLKQLSALLKEVKEIQGILSPLEKEKQLAEIVLLRKKADEEKAEDGELAVFIEGDAAEYAK